MKLIELMTVYGTRVSIPVEKITGITESLEEQCGNTFVATGADTPDGGINGWYVRDEYIDVRMTIEAIV